MIEVRREDDIFTRKCFIRAGQDGGDVRAGDLFMRAVGLNAEGEAKLKWVSAGDCFIDERVIVTASCLDQFPCAFNAHRGASLKIRGGRVGVTVCVDPGH